MNLNNNFLFCFIKKAALYLLVCCLFLSYSNSDEVTVTDQKTVATYNIVFTKFWNESDYGSLPNNPHWSPLVGTNHNSSVTFLEEGGIASQGIEDIAEDGVNSNFNNEVLESIVNGNSQ